MTIGLVYLLNKMRYELLMSQHFFYMIKKYQEKMQSKYQRKRGPGEKTNQSSETETSPKEDMKDLYKEIEKSKETEEKARLEKLQS